MARARDRASGWTDLTWSELAEWAGERSLQRGRRYFEAGHVTALAKADDGELLATVQGTEKYVTAVAPAWAGTNCSTAAAPARSAGAANTRSPSSWPTWTQSKESAGPIARPERPAVGPGVEPPA